MFGISGTELILIAVFAFIIFGPDKIPEIARTVGKAVNMFKRTQEDMERLVKAEMYGIDPEKTAGMVTGRTPEDTPAETAKRSTASEQYGIVDDEEEDEE